jgi:serine/threonine protein phosphatase PrpC
MQVHCAAATHQGRRSNNQDSAGFSVFPKAKGCLLAYATVCDGMGGHAGGERASRILVDTIRDSLDDPPDVEKQIPAWCRSVVKDAYYSMVAAADADSHLGGMGSTMVLVLVTAESIWVSSLGDSRVYHWHAGQFEQVTRDHTMANELLEQGQIELGQLITDEQLRRNYTRLSKCVMDGQSVDDPDIFQIPIEGSHRLLLCSDGLCGELGGPILHDEEFAGMLADENRKARDILQTLIQEAFNRGSTDNITAAIVELGKGLSGTRDKSVLDLSPGQSTRVSSKRQTTLLAGAAAFLGLVLIAMVTWWFIPGSIGDGNGAGDPQPTYEGEVVGPPAGAELLEPDQGSEAAIVADPVTASTIEPATEIVSHDKHQESGELAVVSTQEEGRGFDLSNFSLFQNDPEGESSARATATEAGDYLQGKLQELEPFRYLLIIEGIGRRKYQQTSSFTVAGSVSWFGKGAEAGRTVEAFDNVVISKKSRSTRLADYVSVNKPELFHANDELHLTLSLDDDKLIQRIGSNGQYQIVLEAGGDTIRSELVISVFPESEELLEEDKTSQSMEKTGRVFSGKQEKARKSSKAESDSAADQHIQNSGVTYQDSKSIPLEDNEADVGSQKETEPNLPQPSDADAVVDSPATSVDDPAMEQDEDSATTSGDDPAMEQNEDSAATSVDDPAMDQDKDSATTSVDDPAMDQEDVSTQESLPAQDDSTSVDVAPAASENQADQEKND